MTVNEPRATEVTDHSEEPPASSSSLQGLPLNAMPALNPLLQGQVDAPTDLDVESEHERLREGKKEKSARKAASVKSSPSPSDDGDEPPREKVPRLNALSNYADKLASAVPVLWSPAAREVAADTITMETTGGYDDDFYRKKFCRTTAGHSTKRGVDSKQMRHVHQERVTDGIISSLKWTTTSSRTRFDYFLNNQKHGHRRRHGKVEAKFASDDSTPRSGRSSRRPRANKSRIG